MVGAGSADFSELLAFVKIGLSGAAAVIESIGSPFVASSVVAGEEDEGVVEGVVFFQEGDELAEALVNVIDHGGEGGHTVGEVFFSIFIEGVPGGVGFAVEAVGDGGFVIGDGGEAGEGPGVVCEAEMFLFFPAFFSEDVPALAVGFQIAVACFCGGMEGEMGGGMGEIEEEGFVFVFLTEGLSGEVEGVGVEGISGVVFFEGEGRAISGEALVVLGIPLVLAVVADVAVEVIEAAFDGVFGCTDVPLADAVGIVAGGFEGLGEGDALLVEFVEVGGAVFLGLVGSGEVGDTGLM